MNTIEIKSYLVEDNDWGTVEFIDKDNFYNFFKQVKKEIENNVNEINILWNLISQKVQIDELFDYWNLLESDRLWIWEDEKELIVEYNLKLLLSKAWYYVDYDS